MLCSSAPLFFASLSGKFPHPVLFILNDADEAGYFYHDLTQILGRSRHSSSPPATDVP